MRRGASGAEAGGGLALADGDGLAQLAHAPGLVAVGEDGVGADDVVEAVDGEVRLLEAQGDGGLDGDGSAVSSGKFRRGTSVAAPARPYI